MKKILNPSPRVNRHSRGAAGLRLAAFGAGVELFDDSAEVGVEAFAVRRGVGVIDLLGVQVHFDSAGRADHLVPLRHAQFPPSSSATCSRPWRRTFAIQTSSLKNLSRRPT